MLGKLGKQGEGFNQLMLQLGQYIRETQEHRASLECEPSDMTKNMAGSQEETETPVEWSGKKTH